LRKAGDLVETADYENRSKKRRQDSTRKRKMPFKKLMYFMLSLVKESSQNALERFPENKRGGPHEPTGIQPGAAKGEWEAFEELFRASVRGSYNEALKERRGYLVMAVDGSHIALPADAALREYYGAAGHEWRTAAARASVLYDLENDIIVDARLEPLTVDERSLAKEHPEVLTGTALDRGGRKPLVLFDRGYPSKDLITYGLYLVW
jgi:hypothetical protein